MCNSHVLPCLVALAVAATASGQEVNETVLAASRYVGLGAKTVRIDGGRLAYIDLRGSAYTDASAQLFSLTPDLTYLSLNGCTAGDQTLAGLRATKLEWLILDGTRVSDGGLKYLQELPLRTLSLADTNVTDLGFASISKLSMLRRLSLANTKVSAAGLADLGNLPSLEDLDIRGIPLTAETVRAVSNCKCLERLRASGDRLNDRIVEEFRQLSTLKTLELTLTDAVARVPVRMRELLPGVEVIEDRLPRVR